MPDVRAQLIISAKDEASATMKQVGKTNQETVEGLKITNTMILAGVTAVGLAMKDAIDTTLNWGQTIDKLSRASGENATETSKMAIVMSDYGIKVDGLDKVIKAFTKNGLQFNLDTIKDLAQQYQAIQDPVERDAFAFKNFGRSAMDMTEILSKTPAELDAVGAAAMSSGKILNDQMVGGLQASGVKFQQFQDKIDGLKIALGIPLIGVLGSAIDGFYNLAKVVQSVDIAIMAHTGVISWDEATAREAAVAQGDLTAAYKTVLPAFTAQTNAINIGNVALPAFAGYLKDTNREYSGAAGLIATYTNNLDLQASTQEKARINLEAYNKAMAGQLAAGLGGQLTKAQQDYNKTISENDAKILDLTTDLNNLTAAQGQNVTIVDKGKYSADQLAVAQERLHIAEMRLSETHTKSAATLANLQLSVQTAQATVDRMTASQTTASSVSADYSTKIGADTDAIAALREENAAAEAALRKTTAQLLYQQVAADLDAKSSLALAEKLGLIDERSYKAAAASQELADQFHSGKITLDEFTAAEQYLADGANGAADALARVKAAEDALYNKTITITTLYGQGGPGYEPVVTSPGGGGGGAPGGGYVNPASGGSLNSAALTAAIHNLPSAVARSVRDAMQMVVH